ncbi:MAG: hypothetical protein HQK89_16245 [Nitrospirae bacterium]|nr:hypothetical protein [Nitrospirota bacterium]
MSGTIAGNTNLSSITSVTSFTALANGIYSNPNNYPLWLTAGSGINASVLFAGVSTSNNALYGMVVGYILSNGTPAGVFTSNMTMSGLSGLINGSFLASGTWSGSGSLVAIPLDSTKGAFQSWVDNDIHSTYTTPPTNTSNYDLGLLTGMGGNITGDYWSGGVLHGTGYHVLSLTGSSGISSVNALGVYGTNTLDVIFSEIMLETPQYLFLACNDSTGATCSPVAQNTAKLGYLNLPAVEVGTTSLSGGIIAGSDYMNIIMQNVHFFAPSTGARPTVFATGNIAGNYQLGAFLAQSGNIGVIPLSDGKGANGIILSFAMNNFNVAGKIWNAVLAGSGFSAAWSGSATLTGIAGGKITPGNPNGSAITGTLNGNGIGIIK